MLSHNSRFVNADSVKIIKSVFFEQQSVIIKLEKMYLIVYYIFMRVCISIPKINVIICKFK